MMMHFGYSPPLVKALLNFSPPVSLEAAKIVENCLSVDEEVDQKFIDAQILEAITTLFEKQRIKENPKLRVKVTFMLGNLLCSTQSIFDEVCKSSLVYKCVALLTEHNDSPVRFLYKDAHQFGGIVQDNLHKSR